MNLKPKQHLEGISGIIYLIYTIYVSPGHDWDVIVLNMLEEKMVSIPRILLRGLRWVAEQAGIHEAVVGVSAHRFQLSNVQVQRHGRKHENTS